MNAFDKVIGYETIKNELLQICDMIHNREVYEELGAKLPQGILLYGDPGLGKTLIAKCFIEESGLKSYVVRRNKGNDDFIGDITATFQKARETAPPALSFSTIWISLPTRTATIVMRKNMWRFSPVLMR